MAGNGNPLSDSFNFTRASAKQQIEHAGMGPLSIVERDRIILFQAVVSYE